jgi:hypothetical protein
LLSLACVLAAGAAFTGAVLLHLAILGSMALLLSLAILAARRPLAQEAPSAKLFAPLLSAVEIAEEGKLHCAEVIGVLGARRSFPAVRGGLIAAPIVAAFFLLLSAADPTLAQWRDAVWSTLSSLSFVPQAVFFLVVGAAVLGAYRIASRTRAEAAAVTGKAEVVERSVFGATERLIVLGAVAALFAVFLVLQLSYLFGNSGARAGSGMTFADAAHRGFIELTLTATLTAALIIVLDRFAARGNREHLVRYCALLLLVESLPMLLSANSRIAHYETAYGYTLLRLYVHVYIALICVGTLLLARQVLRYIELWQLLQQMVISCMLALAVLCFWNHSAWIVIRNVDRYAVTRSMDLDYLEWLATRSPDPIPQLVASLSKLRADDAVRLRALLYRLWSAEESQLSGARILDFREPYWYRWNLRRAQARRSLEALVASGPL